MGLLVFASGILNTDKLLALIVEKKINGQTSTDVLFDNGEKVQLQEATGRDVIASLNCGLLEQVPVVSSER